MCFSMEISNMSAWWVLLMLSAVFSRSVLGTCPHVSSIPVQPNFDFDKFAGDGLKWNMVLYNKIVPVEGLNTALNESNVFSLFKRDKSNARVGRTVGRIRLGSLSFCTNQKSRIENEPGQPAKLRQTFNNPFTKSTLSFNFWILYTDYENLSVVYACQKVLPNGTCHPAHIYFWTFSRGTRHTSEEMKKVTDLAISVCKTTLRRINHQTPCSL